MSTEPLNPVQIEAVIRNVADRIARSVRTCSDAYAAFLKADREYDLAYAKAYDAESGAPSHVRKYRAEVETWRLREARDHADAAYRYADRLARAQELELRAYQSVGASVRAMYSVAGRGE